jgi:ABC-type phosphate transport system substrate-binding protein
MSMVALRLIALAVVVLAGTDVGAEALAVVVGRDSAVRTVTRDELRDLYLRRQRLWSNGTPAIPVNLPAGSPSREEFSRAILGRSSQELLAHWNARYFEGIRPPVVVPSSAAVLAYLAAEPAAIAYVPAGEVDGTCRVLLTLP